MTPYYSDSACVIYHGDCNDIMPSLDHADLLLTDPPYGINAARDRNSQQYGWKDYPAGGWDKVRPADELIRALPTYAKHAIIWGGNYFSDLLPPSQGWLVWDKGQRDFSLADGELAWTSFDNALRIYTIPRGRALRDGKQHPTQKSIALMLWSIAYAEQKRTCKTYDNSGPIHGVRDNATRCQGPAAQGNRH